MAAVEKRARLRGLATGWLESGDPTKPIFLFLHGYPDGPDIWDKQAEHFSRDYHVIRPYARGVGPSEPSPDTRRYGHDGMALDWLEVLKSIDPKSERPVVLAGHDLGAVQACHLAPLLGPRLRALVIFNGISSRQFLRRLANPAQQIRSWYIYLMQLPKIPELIARAFPRRILAAGRGRLALRPAGRVPLDRVVNPIQQYRALFREGLGFARSRTPRLKAPVLVVWGCYDPFIVTPTTEEWERFASSVTIRILPGSHWLYREKPQQVNALVAEFLESALGGSKAA